MQLYLLAPGILYLVYRYKAKALFILCTSILGCMGCTLAVHLKHNLTTMCVFLPFINLFKLNIDICTYILQVFERKIGKSSLCTSYSIFSMDGWCDRRLFLLSNGKETDSHPQGYYGIVD